MTAAACKEVICREKAKALLNALAWTVDDISHSGEVPETQKIRAWECIIDHCETATAEIIDVFGEGART